LAAGDVKTGLTASIASGAYLDIRPAGGEEWVLKTIYFEADVTLEFYDGSNSIIFKTYNAADEHPCDYQIDNTRRIRVKNTNAGTKHIGYSAVQTK
jgi:hypothetical protein